MTGRLVLLAGLLGVPLLLLWTGHRLQRRSDARRAAFWGGLTGHLVALPLATLAALLPPAEWSPDDRTRGALGFWALLVLPALGAAVALLKARRRRPARH